MFKNGAALVWVLLLSIGSAFAQGKTHEKLSVHDFKAKLDKSHDAVLLDLRTPDEVKQGVIPGAVQLDYFVKDFEKRVGKLDPNKTYFIYCASGGRSGETFDLMKTLGFREVYELPAGFAGWQRAKLPVGKLKSGR